jgi:2',3'-cyclic-nucleotide 2'-phosphodiesterase (5'-nucleotidase family)
MGKASDIASGGLMVRTLMLSAMLVGSINGMASGADGSISPPRPEVTAQSAANPWPPPPSSVHWSQAGAVAGRTVHLQLLGFNDFHGNLQSPSVSSPRPVGGAAALAGYIKALERAAPGRTLIVQAGDQLGASPPITSLLHNEPAIEFLNLIANPQCRYGSAMQFYDAQHWQREPNHCNVVGTLGNHEFDAGPAEIHRLLGGGNAPGGYDWQGALRGIVAQLDPDIDVVISGHTHNYTNALLPGRGAAPVLVTQAYAYGVAVAQIDLRIDPATRDVVAKSARIVPTWADAPPGKPGDPGARRLTDAAQKLVAARVGRVVGQLQQPMTRALSAAGESTLGDLVADAQRTATHADIALMNPGGLRSDLRAGPVTWGDVLTLHPFANHLITLDMTGAQLLAVLEEQWPLASNALPRILKTSGLYYSWDPARPAGARIVEACDLAHEPVGLTRHYRVTVNDFLANGGDGFATLKALGAGESGPLDSEALEQYLENHSTGTAVAAPRIARADLAESHLCAAH